MRKILLTITNHFDLAWRRAYDRRIEDEGRVFVSYAELEAMYIMRNLEFAKEYEDYKFQVESVAVLRHFLENHPEHTEEIKELAAKKRLYVPGVGDNIVDSNLIHGETLVRNYVRGLLWTEEELGYLPKLAVRNDAFGNSAQLPQILRNCGIKWLNGINYVYCDGDYWRGLDGSTVYCKSLPLVGSGGTWYKYAPCPDCQGVGEKEGAVCPTCGGFRINEAKMGKEVYDIFWFPDKWEDSEVGMVTVGGEEMLPDKVTIDWAHNEKNYDVEFAFQEEAYPYVEKAIDRVDNPDLTSLHPYAELNPANTGCYTSRIDTKLNMRRQEYALLGAESLSALAFLMNGEYPREEFSKLWNEFLVTAFHDCVTGTYVDTAHEEQIERWGNIDDMLSKLTDCAAQMLTENDEHTVSVYNPTGAVGCGFISIEQDMEDTPISLLTEEGQRILPLEISTENHKKIYKFWIADLQSFGARSFTIEETETAGNTVLCPEAESAHCTGTEFADALDEQTTAGAGNILQGGESSEQARAGAQQSEEKVYRIENERYYVEADRYGILRIGDKKLSCLISEAGEYRPGEYILEHDEGSPWATLSNDQKRIPLARFTRLIGMEKKSGYERLTFEIEDRDALSSYVILSFRIVYTVTLYQGVGRVEFVSETDWDDYNHRMRIAFPAAQSGRALYEIPYGVLERGESPKKFNWAGCDGDWPAHNWVGVEGEQISTVLMNHGTPSAKVEKGDKNDIILMTVRRCPGVPTYLHEPINYTMTKWNGMRDAGKHSFTYALVGYAGALADSPVVADAEVYNAGLLSFNGKMKKVEAPAVTCDHAMITSLKVGEREDCLIARVVEVSGKAGEVTVSAPTGYETVSKVNMLEREDVAIADGSFEIRPFEIATLKFSKAK